MCSEGDGGYESCDGGYESCDGGSTEVSDDTELMESSDDTELMESSDDTEFMESSDTATELNEGDDSESDELIEGEADAEENDLSDDIPEDIPEEQEEIEDTADDTISDADSANPTESTEDTQDEPMDDAATEDTATELNEDDDSESDELIEGDADAEENDLSDDNPEDIPEGQEEIEDTADDTISDADSANLTEPTEDTQDEPKDDAATEDTADDTTTDVDGADIEEQIVDDTQEDVADEALVDDSANDMQDVSDDIPADETVEGAIVDTSDNTEQANNLSDYMNKHNYTPEDFDKYSQDPEWRELQSKEFPDYELPPLTQENAMNQLSDYMNSHNYGRDDFDTYSQDPKWRELQRAAFPDYELPEIRDIYDNDLLSKEYANLSNRDAMDLSKPELQSIERYTGSDYSSINKTLYSDNYNPGSTYMSDRIQNDINNLTNVLDRKEIPYDSKVYRGINNMSAIFGDDYNNLSVQELNDKYSGSYFINEGFTSTSTDYNVADGFSGTFDGGIQTINIPKGSNGMALGDVSVFNDGEKEILLQRGSIYQIDSVSMSDSNKMIVKTKLVGSKEE